MGQGPNTMTPQRISTQQEPPGYLDIFTDFDGTAGPATTAQPRQRPQHDAQPKAQPTRGKRAGV